MAKIAPNLAVERLKSTMAQNNMMRRARKKDSIIDVKQDLGNVLLLSQSNGKGYIIPTDDDVSPILHQADSLNFDYVMSPEFEFLLGAYNEAVEYYPQREIEVSNTEDEATVMSNVLRAASSSKSSADLEGVLINKYFTQGGINPSSTQTPSQVAVNAIPWLAAATVGKDDSNNQFQYGRSVGGCVPLSVLLQLYFMYTKKGYNYLRLPAAEGYISTRVFKKGTEVYGTEDKEYDKDITYSIELSSLKSYVPNFKLISMVPKYHTVKVSGEMTKEELEYARLVRHIGQLLNASYSPRATGAHMKDAVTLFRNLGFTNVNSMTASGNKNFFSTIRTQLQSGYPVLISGSISTESGSPRHAFNLTGFRQVKKNNKNVNEYYVDLNYGPNQGNGWTQLEVLNENNTLDYKYKKEIVYNLNSINPTSVAGSGDVNGDGRIDISDVLLVIDYVTKKEWNVAHPENPKTLPDINMEAADVDGDGEVTRNDAYEIVDIILGRDRGATAEEIKKQQE